MKRILSICTALVCVVGCGETNDTEDPPPAPIFVNGCEIKPFTDCFGIDLSGENLSGANLEGANLGEAALIGTNLEGANLKGARLAFSTLAQAKLSGASLVGADTSRVNFNGADLTGADFLKATLTGARWRGATCPDGTKGDDHGGSCLGHLVDLSAVCEQDVDHSLPIVSACEVQRPKFA